MVKRWKQSKCLSRDEWRQSNVYNTMEYYSALKRKEILLHATAWENLGDIMVSEISQLQGDTYSMISHRVVKFIEIEIRMLVPRGQGKWAKKRCCLMCVCVLC